MASQAGAGTYVQRVSRRCRVPWGAHPFNSSLFQGFTPAFGEFCADISNCLDEVSSFFQTEPKVFRGTGKWFTGRDTYSCPSASIWRTALANLSPLTSRELRNILALDF